jgi:hypothetical protein
MYADLYRSKGVPFLESSMAPAADQSAVIACIPDAIPPEERAAHFALAKRLLTEIANQREQLPEGYAFRLPSEALRSVAQFVANERKCCPFIHFEISVAPNSGVLWLRMTGPAGTRAVLDAELNLSTCGATSCGCAK